MKKIIYIFMILIPTILLFNIVSADAKVEKKESATVKDNWLENKLENINKKYDEAIIKIKESTFSDKNKKVLSEQAEENKDLAIECAKKRNILRERHKKERENLILQMKLKTENRKAVQNVMNIY